MKKEVSPVTAAIVIGVVLVILVVFAWRYFFSEPATVPLGPDGLPRVGGPGIPPPGFGPGGQPGGPAGQPGAPAAPQQPPSTGR